MAIFCDSLFAIRYLLFAICHLLFLSYVGACGHIAASASPIGVEKLTARFVNPLVSMRPKVISLGLEQIGRQTPVTVVNFY